MCDIYGSTWNHSHCLTLYIKKDKYAIARSLVRSIQLYWTASEVTTNNLRNGQVFEYLFY